MKNTGKFFVIVFVCFLMNVKSGESFGTFGFDVHHRYSDRVKDFLGHNGLPEKGTMEYYAALAHRDHLFKARGLAGGSDGSTPDSPPSSTSVLTFLEGNDTYRVSSLGYMHYSIVTVGTPPLDFVVALDTGSDLFWLPCDCTNCSRSLNSSTGKPLKLEIYSPSTSSTSSLVPCITPMCGPRSGCLTGRNACAYVEVYHSANTSSTGILVDDVLRLRTDETPTRPVNVPITLGCGIIQTGDFLDGNAINGLLGLGMGSISVPSVLARKGLIEANSLSMCFGPDGLGRIEFGYKGIPDQKTTPFNLPPPFNPVTLQPSRPSYNVTVTQIAVGRNATNLTFTAVFESGTSFTYMTDPAYTFITEAFISQIKEQRYRPVNPLIFDYCYELGANQESYFTPDLNLTMAGGAQFYVTAPTIVLRRKTGGSVYCLALVKSDNINIIGQNFMTGYRMVFDRDEMVLGWEKSDCLDSILSTNTTTDKGNSTNASPPPSIFRNRTSSTLSPPPPPPSPTRQIVGSNAAKLSSVPTNILMVVISITFHHSIVLCL